jgi:CBS domain-containing protein
MLVREILDVKGRLVLTCAEDDTLADVVDKLVANNCGSLVVCDDGGQMIGIITERDILRASATVRGSLEFVRVSERMSRTPAVAGPEDSVGETMGTMTERRIRHLPVIEEGRLAGMISIGDVVKAQHDELCRENHYLKSYIQS